MPERIQLRRTRGWRKPDGAVVVARPSRWGNPWRLAPWSGGCTVVDRWGNEYSVAAGDWRGVAVRHFREDLMDGRLDFDPVDVVEALAGRDLACWCPLEDAQGRRVPCHADVLLELANEDGGNPTC